MSHIICIIKVISINENHNTINTYNDTYTYGVHTRKHNKMRAKNDNSILIILIHNI